MFKQILLPVDLADRHMGAMKVATELAGQGGGEVILLHVIEVIAGLSIEEEKDFYRRLEKMARNRLAKLGKQLQDARVPWRAEVLYGNRGPEVVRYARDRGID